MEFHFFLKNFNKMILIKITKNVQKLSIFMELILKDLQVEFNIMNN